MLFSRSSNLRVGMGILVALGHWCGRDARASSVGPCSPMAEAAGLNPVKWRFDPSHG